MRNTGAATAVFQVRTTGNAQPRSFTVESGKDLTDSWDAESGYDLAVHGPNGFFRRFRGGDPGTSHAKLDVEPSYDLGHNTIVLAISNGGSERARVMVRDGYASRRTELSLDPGATDRSHWSWSRTRGWYDLVVTTPGDPSLEYRFAGHVEDGEDSITDPAMGGLLERAHV
jgi:phospholipase C